MLISLYLTNIYPRTIRKYKLLAARHKAEADKLKKEYDRLLNGYTDWFLEMEKRLSELTNIVYDKINENERGIIQKIK